VEEMTMKRFVILAAFALAFVLVLIVAVGGGAAEAACVATNCAIDAQQGTSPAQGDSTGADVATTPKLENALKDLGSASAHALTHCGSNCTTRS
jgi:hypothetical protein